MSNNELKKRASYHKKKQKGLSPFGTLNKDAGNVEYNIAMFNHANNPAKGPCNNPVSGPFGGDVGSAGGGMGESFNEALYTQTPYMLRNDGIVLTCGKVHPYICQDIDGKPFSEIQNLFNGRLGQDLLWFYKNTQSQDTRQLCKRVVELIFSKQDYYHLQDNDELFNALNITNITDRDIEPFDIEQSFLFLNLQTNQEFCRVRTSNIISGGNLRSIYFRISSIDFNWFDLIWKFVLENKKYIDDITIVADKYSKGIDYVYKHNGTLIDHLPIEEFINLSGRPIIECFDSYCFKKGYFKDMYKNYNPHHIVNSKHQKLNDFIDENFVQVDHCFEKSITESVTPDSSILNELNSLETVRGTSKVSYELVSRYKEVLNQFPIGTVLQHTHNAGTEKFTKVEDGWWDHFRAPWKDTRHRSEFDIAQWLAGRAIISRSPIEYANNDTSSEDLKESGVYYGDGLSDGYWNRDNSDYFDASNKKSKEHPDVGKKAKIKGKFGTYIIDRVRDDTYYHLKRSKEDSSEIMAKIDDIQILKEDVPQKKETIELEYKNLEFEQFGPKQYDGDYDCWDRRTDWTYEVDKDDLYTYIFESCIDEEDFPEAFDDVFNPNDPTDWEKFSNWLDDNFDTIFSKYEKKILDAYEEDVVQDAQDKYDPDDYVDWDIMPGGHDDYYIEKLAKDDLKENETVFMESYKMESIEEKPNEPTMTDYFKLMDKEDN